MPRARFNLLWVLKSWNCPAAHVAKDKMGYPLVALDEFSVRVSL